jgi:hypothetical protein
VSLRVGRVVDGRIRVTWGDGFTTYPSYDVNASWIKSKVVAVRSALEALGGTYRQARPDNETAMAELAKQGHNLRKALFRDRFAEDAATADEVLAWFEGLGPVTVTVNADASLPVPWGALHENGAPGEDTYENFWAPRFKVAAVYSGMRALPGRRTAGAAKLLAGLNQEVYGRTQALLDEVQQSAIDTMLKRPVGPAFTVEGCRTRWRAVGDCDCVIYFFGHATGEAILFNGQGEKLSADDFRDVFRRESSVVLGRTPALQVLTVLNGCLSASGADAESFMLATAEPGFYGFVGAEAPVPDRFGLLFGHDLLKALLEDRLSVREAMATLWAKHRPLGLLYGCYAHPGLTVAPYAG